MDEKEIISAYFAKLGRKSGTARMKKMTAKDRSRVASEAAKARWAKTKKKARGKGSK